MKNAVILHLMRSKENMSVKYYGHTFRVLQQGVGDEKLEKKRRLGPLRYAALEQKGVTG